MQVMHIVRKSSLPAPTHPQPAAVPLSCCPSRAKHNEEQARAAEAAAKAAAKKKKKPTAAAEQTAAAEMAAGEQAAAGEAAAEQGGQAAGDQAAAGGEDVGAGAGGGRRGRGGRRGGRRRQGRQRRGKAVRRQGTSPQLGARMWWLRRGLALSAPAGREQWQQRCRAHQRLAPYTALFLCSTHRAPATCAPCTLSPAGSCVLHQ